MFKIISRFEGGVHTFLQTYYCVSETLACKKIYMISDGIDDAEFVFVAHGVNIFEVVVAGATIKEGVL